MTQGGHISTEPRINERIRVPEVRLVGPAGEQVGIVAINDALRLAQEADLDLVEVAPQARPPVCKLMDYGKFKYESALKARESRKNQAQTVIKEIKLRPKIDPHDYGTKKGHVERFLKQGDKVKVTIMFRGREQSRPELGFKLLQRLAGDIEELGFVESSPKQDGRNMIMVLGPHKRKTEAMAAARADRASRASARSADLAEQTDLAEQAEVEQAELAEQAEDAAQPTAAAARPAAAEAAPRTTAPSAAAPRSAAPQASAPRAAESRAAERARRHLPRAVRHRRPGSPPRQPSRLRALRRGPRRPGRPRPGRRRPGLPGQRRRRSQRHRARRLRLRPGRVRLAARPRSRPHRAAAPERPGPRLPSQDRPGGRAMARCRRRAR